MTPEEIWRFYSGFAYFFYAWKLHCTVIAIARKRATPHFLPSPSHVVETAWGLINYGIIFIFGWAIPFNKLNFQAAYAKSTELKVMEVERINTKPYRSTLVSLLMAFYSRNANEKKGRAFWGKMELWGDSWYNLSLVLARSFLLQGLFIPLKISGGGKMFALIYSSSLSSWCQTPSPHVCHPLISSISLPIRSYGAERFINGL